MIGCLIFSTVFFSCRKEVEPNTSSKATEQSVVQNNAAFDFLPKSITGQIVKHKGYTLSYSEPHEQAEWVAYELKKSELNYNNNEYERPYFIEDPFVKTGSADWRNYRRSGYDKGHLCPAGDRKYSRSAFEETFYTSNISPQRHDFNEGIWNRLEQKVRYWASKYDGVYVVTGGVLQNTKKAIGDEDVTVPDYFYKVLLDYNDGTYKMIAFLVPHKDSDRPLYEFVISVDALEKLTGINFYPTLPDALENKLESSNSYKEWSFR